MKDEKGIMRISTCPKCGAPIWCKQENFNTMSKPPKLIYGCECRKWRQEPIAIEKQIPYYTYHSQPTYPYTTWYVGYPIDNGVAHGTSGSVTHTIGNPIAGVTTTNITSEM